jgi:hypothetical protein
MIQLKVFNRGKCSVHKTHIMGIAKLWNSTIFITRTQGKSLYLRTVHDSWAQVIRKSKFVIPIGCLKVYLGHWETFK